jgi:hypothetical protein
MQRFPALGRSLGLFAPFLLLLSLACGSARLDNVVPTPARVVIDPPTFSLGHGLTQAASVFVLDANDQIMGGFAATFQSSNPAIVTIAPDGTICGGVWNAANTICAPGPGGMAEITATAGGVTSAPARVWVHKRVDRVTLSPATVDCVSQGESAVFSATAFAGDENITDTVGPPLWRVTPLDVAFISTENLPRNQVEVVADQPGQAAIFGTLGNVNSLTSTFRTCSPATITVQVENSMDTAIELEPAALKQLEANVVDTAGKPIEDLPLVWLSTNTHVATVTADGGLVRGAQPGEARITAACRAPGCMHGLNESHYGNLVDVRVTGTANASVFVVGRAAKAIVPIPIDTHTVGATVSLPHEPNSFLFNPLGTRAYLGSDNALMIVEPIEVTVFISTAARGKVLAVSSNRVVISDTANGRVYIWNANDQVVTAILNLSGVTAAAISLDETKVFLLGGSNLYVWAPTAPTLRTFVLSNPAGAAAFTTDSRLAYLSGGSPQNIAVHNGCNSEPLHSIAVPAPPVLLAAIPDNSGVLAVDPPNVHHIEIQVSGPTCDPVVVDPVTTRDFGVGAFEPRQLVVTSDGKRAFLVYNGAQVLAYDIEAKTTSTIPLQGSASEALGAGVLLDGRMLYVGAIGAENAVHRIDLATGEDVQQIVVPFVPDFVALRPR